MKILVINCGSSSLKYCLIESEGEHILSKGTYERIDCGGDYHNHADAIAGMLEELTNPEKGIINSLYDIDAVGHRVVHGGEIFNTSCLITDNVINVIVECSELAPLHNPANLAGINACRAHMPNVPMVAVFDTAFHQTMPEKAYLYGLPYNYYEDYKIRRYGFHGISHNYVSDEALKYLKLDKLNSKVIVCHLGNGSSISAIHNGRSLDTTMGFTPLEGLIMGTRCGDIDPTIIEYLARKTGQNVSEVISTFNKESGLKGISLLSSDFRDVYNAANVGNRNAKLAIDIFVYRIVKYIGSYVAAMNGVDAIVFTGGIGENSTYIREAVCDYLTYLGIELNYDANHSSCHPSTISSIESAVAVIVMPTNEELLIARETAYVTQTTNIDNENTAQTPV